MSSFSSANITDGNLMLKERTHRIKIKYSMHQYSIRFHNLGNWLMCRTLHCPRITPEHTRYHQRTHRATCLWNLFVSTPAIISSWCILPTQTFFTYRQVEPRRTTTFPLPTTTQHTVMHWSTPSTTATAWTATVPTARSWYAYSYKTGLFIAN